ncbi:MAG: PBECR2 nuclease fold domain-containing protein, partial [Bacteroidota bacterium]|nr:PBECR2 nuclease fold domain-containing protein [Bacteroidota bacterium]
LKEAEEVWLTEEKLTAYTYIKYYQDVAIQIVVKMDNGSLKLISWYEIAEKESVISKARRGLLIKR